MTAAVEQEQAAAPAAWIDFADTGHVRFWTSDAERAAREKRQGRHLRMFTLAELVALAGRPKPDAAAPRYRHLKRGTTYTIVSQEFVEIWSSESDHGDRGFAWCALTGERAKVQGKIESRSFAVFYRADSDGALWARSAAEFFDGRFEAL